MHANPRPRRPLGTAVFRPPRALGVITGGAFSAWAIVLGLLVAILALGADASFKTFLATVVAASLVLLGLLFGWWAYCIWTLTYTVDRGSLAIRWGGRTIYLPISGIQRMVPGRTVDLGRIRGLTWWGCRVGSAAHPRLGQMLVFSTHSSAEQVLVLVTSSGSFAITILDQAAFAEEIQARAGLGPVVAHPPAATVHGLVGMGLWRDRVFIVTFAIAAIGLVALSAFVFVRYPGLADVVPLHFPGSNSVARAGNKTEFLRIVYLGAGILFLNAVLAVAAHARERAAAIWLLASGALLQVVLLAAAVSGITRA